MVDGLWLIDVTAGDRLSINYQPSTKTGMAILLQHNEVIFEHETVYLTGNAFIGCTFRRCTLVMKAAGDVILNSCRFEACVWHLDFLISDHRVWESFTETVGPMIQQSLPRAAARGSDGDN